MMRLLALRLDKGATMQDITSYGLYTNLVHAGYCASHTGDPVVPALVQSTTARYSLSNPAPFSYSRVANPNRMQLESALAALEGGRDAAAFSSDNAATMAVLQLLPQGASVLADRFLYAGSVGVLAALSTQAGLRVEFVDFGDIDALAKRLAQAPVDLLWFETPTNPVLRIRDVARVAEVARAEGNQRRPLLAVDNTFASPALQRPLSMGADIVMHSTSKYINGHSDVIGGVVVVQDAAHGQALHRWQAIGGAVPSPSDCALALRGLRTLGLRMERQCDNALHLAEVLAKHAKVRRVRYPGLPTSADRGLAARQMRGRFGAVVCVDLDCAPA